MRPRTSCRCTRPPEPGRPACRRPGRRMPGHRPAMAGPGLRGYRRAGPRVGVPRLVRAHRRRQVPAPGLAVGGSQPAPRGAAPHLGPVGSSDRRPVPLAWPVPGPRPRPAEPAARYRVHRRRARPRGPAPGGPRQRRAAHRGQRLRRGAASSRSAVGDGRLRHPGHRTRPGPPGPGITSGLAGFAAHACTVMAGPEGNDSCVGHSGRRLHAPPSRPAAATQQREALAW